MAFESLFDLYVPEARKEGREAFLDAVQSELNRSEQEHIAQFSERRANGEVRYHDKECGLITRSEELEFMHVVKEEYPCGCPKSGIVVRNWWNKWSAKNYMDPTWDFKYLSPVWMENLSLNYHRIRACGKSFQNMISPFGPVCRDGNCINSACTDRRIRRHAAPDARGPFEDKPCYIIGSGPSLKKNHKELSRVKGGLRIAINGAVPLLDDFEMFLTMDWKGASWWSKDQHEKLARSVGVIGWSVNPSVMTLPFSDMVLFSQAGKCPWDHWIRDVFPWMLDLDRGFSSTFCAFHLAVQMGCNPIVFVGCDGCFGEDMVMHAAHDDRPKGAEHDMIKHRDIEGREVDTCVTYFLQNQCLKGAAAWASLHGLQIINATEGGIFFLRSKEGEEVIQQRKLSDVVDEFNVKEELNAPQGIQAGSEVSV